MTAYRVAEGRQVNFAGVVYGAGDKVTPDPEMAAQWLAAGYLEPLPKMPARPAAPGAS